MRSHDVEGQYWEEPRRPSPPRLSVDESPTPPADETAAKEETEDKPKAREKR